MSLATMGATGGLIVGNMSICRRLEETGATKSRPRPLAALESAKVWVIGSPKGRALERAERRKTTRNKERIFRDNMCGCLEGGFLS